MPMRRAAFRTAALGALAGALMLVGGPALASTGTGSQNPALTVTVTLTNPGGGADGDPETATRGETVNAAVSLKNNTARAQKPVLVRVTAQDPAGGPLFQRGTYTVTLSASLDGQWSSVADASITLV
jgi:hypothetical protein